MLVVTVIMVAAIKTVVISLHVRVILVNDLVSLPDPCSITHPNRSSFSIVRPQTNVFVNNFVNDFVNDFVKTKVNNSTVITVVMAVTVITVVMVAISSHDLANDLVMVVTVVISLHDLVNELVKDFCKQLE